MDKNVFLIPCKKSVNERRIKIDISSDEYNESYSNQIMKDSLENSINVIPSMNVSFIYII